MLADTTITSVQVGSPRVACEAVCSGLIRLAIIQVQIR